MHHQRRPLLRWVAAALPFLAVPALACHPAGDDAEPTDNAAQLEKESLEGKVVEFALEPGAVDRAQIEAVAHHAESLGDVSAAKVKVTAADDDATVITVELWGSNFPDEDAIASAMRAEFPFMKDAVITVADLDADPPVAVQEAAHEEEDPEALKRRIVDDLRAKGVEGDIHVEVKDDGDGHREVEVHVDSDEPGDAELVQP